MSGKESQDVTPTATQAIRPELLSGHYPNKGRQGAASDTLLVSNSLCARQTPEQFGGISTD